MNHLDEGTIHAWLDGAVDATRAREIETHVASCPTCSAAVAEARGFIAGASRILDSLDDVPAGVTPKRLAQPPTRQWRASRWVTSIAAALMLAVGVTTWNRDAVKDAMRSTAPMRVQGVEALAPSADTGPGAGSVAGAPLAKRAAPARELSRAVQAPRAEADAQDRQDARRADVLPAPRETAARNAAPPAAAMPSPALAAPSIASASERSRRMLGDTPMRLESVVVTGATAGRAGQIGELSKTVSAAGCYRVDRSASMETASRAAGRAAASDRSRERARAPKAVAPLAAELSETLSPSVVRLDTLRRAPGYVVRSTVTDSIVGYWSPWRGDSARITLPADGIFVFAVKDRVVCPER